MFSRGRWLRVQPNNNAASPSFRAKAGGEGEIFPRASHAGRGIVGVFNCAIQLRLPDDWLATAAVNAYDDAMQRSLVMTVIGEDRPGLVESVASLVAEHGGNWLESRMARLGGKFAGIVQVEVPAERESQLVQALNGLSGRGLNVLVTADRPVAAESGSVSRLEIVGQDRPGIVRQISQALASFNVNVEELETECESAAMSGETLFKARARLSIPASCDVAVLRQTLERIAADLIVEISFQPER